MKRVVALLFVSIAACSSGGGGASPGAAPQPARGNANYITEQEIAGGSYQTALEIIENLRPTMLRLRASAMSSNDSPTGLSTQGPTSVNVVVYLDEVRLGETSSLRTIMAQTVKEIRYINGRDATTRWGTGHSSGVIQVVTKR